MNSLLLSENSNSYLRLDVHLDAHGIFVHELIAIDWRVVKNSATIESLLYFGLFKKKFMGCAVTSDKVVLDTLDRLRQLNDRANALNGQE